MSNYVLHPQLLFRLPLFSFAGPLQSFLEAKPDQQVEVLKTIFRRPDLQEAIFLASPRVYEECIKWLKSEKGGIDNEDKIIMTLLRYLLRISTRCTPFGLFAGCTLGKWGNAYNIKLEDNIRRNTRMDMDYLCKLAQSIKSNEVIQQQLLFFPNNSLYASTEGLRYVEYEYVNNQRSYTLTSVDDNEYIQAILKKASGGADIKTLARSITGEEVGLEEAEDFIREMIEGQVLATDFEGRVTGKQMLQVIISTLSKIADNHPETGKIYEQLIALEKALQQLDHAEAPNAIDQYNHIAESLHAFEIPFEMNRLFQVDMYRPAVHCELDKKLAGTLRAGMNLLNRLTPRNSESYLGRFISKFRDRYDTNELPLLDVLDVETGIGYIQNNQSGGDINPLVDDIFKHAPNTERARRLTWNKHQRYFFEQLLTAAKSGQYEVSLTEDDLKGFDLQNDDMPHSVALLGQIIASPEDGTQYPTVYLKSVIGAATKFIGRFTHLDNSIHEWMEQVADAEQAALEEDEIIAEIVHLPQSRTGNILMRTNFRKHEIPFLAQASVDKAFQIPLADIFISVKENKVVLRSKKLNKRIRPVLSNAHNYAPDALPVYELLCDLEFQGKLRGLNFHWGNFAGQFSFLPRVSFRNLILFRASWQLRKEDYADLVTKKTDLLDSVKIWQSQWKLPDRVLLVEGDNELLIDFRDEWCVRTFIHQVKDRPTILLTEFLFDEQKVLTRDKDGKAMTNEFIAIFHPVKTVDPGIKTDFKTAALNPDVQRSFPPGSSWLYYKLYGGVATNDEILKEYLYPLAESLYAEHSVDQWFFIRYLDTDPHIRIRFYANDSHKIAKLMEQINKHLADLINNKLLWKIQMDTYEREVERYGSSTMTWSEAFFFEDSRTTLNFLREMEVLEEKFRWFYGLFSVRYLLEELEFSKEEELRFLKNGKMAYEREFEVGKDLRKQISKSFSIHREVLEDMYHHNFEGEAFHLLKQHLLKKKERLAPLCKELLNSTDRREIERLLSSHIHMMINRLFKSRQRKYELVIYSFLFKLSNIAFHKKK